MANEVILLPFADSLHQMDNLVKKFQIKYAAHTGKWNIGLASPPKQGAYFNKFTMLVENYCCQISDATLILTTDPEC